ncbi:MAG: FAD-binding oxidoreductase [Synechococcales cyanobacterium T60_A2020_003]|nr:FAD-binding oxidoreductase [Synechococcales cyanobacterium T60_A2020_003]
MASCSPSLSFWIESTTTPPFPSLVRETFDGVSVDVAVIGAGIAGLTTAYQLKQAGKTVAVIQGRS